ncbi:adenylate/guanylate cyclase domain-containing protein [Vampirovibrio chlorellavorus]|uniref:adenylate/guanylate cyclase domain-containing protein n=1 Tax=Vampirovibrio chlorellavorus TaxID=758823 RepID=UPI0026EE6648|nr:adenylate/guanylate cyclase domain-containing protein [Vampirovibrio chlorellavorus]
MSDRRTHPIKAAEIFKFNVLVMAGIIMAVGFPFGARLLNLPLPESLWFIQPLGYGLCSPLYSFYKFLLGPLLPGHWQTFFPVTDVSLFLSVVSGMPVSAFSQYNGQIEWIPLLSVVFWQCFLIVSYYCLSTLRQGASLQEVRKAMVEYREAQAPPAPKAPEPRKPMPPKKPELPENRFVPLAQTQSDNQQKIKERLQESRILQHHAPRIQRLTQQDWDNYKQQEGDLIVRAMIQQLRQENLTLQLEKNELKSTFSQYFSPEVLKYLNQNKSAFEDIQNQHYNMTVLFCDLRGFSAFSQTASPDEMVAYLVEYFEIASYCVLHKYNGVISKLMGDGFMAYWGFPLTGTEHAYTATLAAQNIIQEVRLRNEIKVNQKPLQVGIGIATGPVMVGNIGSMDFKDFTLIGVPVNLAARLQETTKQLGCDIVISENTYRDLNGRIACQDWGATEIRGWQNTERIFSPFPPEGPQR